MKNLYNKILVSSLLLASSQAFAGTTTWEWNLNSSVGNNGDSTLSADGTNNVDSNKLTADLSAFADTTGSNDTKIESGQFGYFGSNNGWGVINQDEDGTGGQHAFDNKGSRLNSYGNQRSSSYKDYDMALISFDTSVELTGVNFGYRSDGDFTLLAYTGAGSFTNSNLTGTTWADQANSGNWLTVGQYNPNVTDAYYSVNSGGTSSKYWLLGAYNSVFGAGGAGIDEHDDTFKLRKLRGNTTAAEEVSAPASFALLLMGLGGIFLRRNKKS